MRAAREQSRTRTACWFDFGGDEGGRGSESPALGPQPPGCSRDEYPSRPWHAGVGFDEIVRPVARATTNLRREEGGPTAETPELAVSFLSIRRTFTYSERHSSSARLAIVATQPNQPDPTARTAAPNRPDDGSPPCRVGAKRAKTAKPANAIATISVPIATAFRRPGAILTSSPSSASRIAFTPRD